ncbi:MAG: 2Fe-2S iron-sulfur cluster-binding protein [Bacteroidales bacterium]|nr:2Fe-2S iron-sulfur cluster-binding protein [Bacteroidales bacterium]
MTIKINNREINVETDNYSSPLLIEILRQEGFDVPSLCYAKEKKHQASCMVCVVKNNETGQIIPSCSTIATDGMNIDSESDEVKNLRKQSLELLLSDHIAVCKPPCNRDQCTLRKYATEYKAKWNTFERYSALKDTSPQHIKDNFWFDVSKCIRCGLCVYNSNDGFTFKDRGFGMQIFLPAESVNNVDESLCEICPTQALYLA